MFGPVRRRLYLQIYVAFVAVGFFALFVTAMTAKVLFDRSNLPSPAIVSATAFLAEDIPLDAGLEAGLRARAERLGLHLTLRSADGRVLAASHAPSPAPKAEAAHWFGGTKGPGLNVPLEDGRWLGASVDHVAHRAAFDHDPVKPIAILLLLGVAVGVGCMPVARRITARIEGLRRGVEEWGTGDLGRRVEVCGSDEVAGLAEAFNRSADRIEELVEGQRRMLASASHELRSPLARLRMAVELLGGEGEVADGAVKDIEELDALIGELLLAARMDAPRSGDAVVRLDLGPIVREEASRVEASVAGAPEAWIDGDARLVRRLVRNLLENARRHGGATVAASLAAGGEVVFAVEDDGPGVPEALRERIFEPFFRPDDHSEGRDGGVGLGLALVQRIAEHHGGTARCVDRAGGGARFEVRLPASTSG